MSFWPLLALMVGCGQKPAPQERIIAASFYPIYLATANVAAGVPGVRVVNLTRPTTGCLHDYQLTPEEMKTLAGAGVLVVNGGGMESFLERVISQQPRLKIIDASQGLELIKDRDGEVNPHVWVSVAGARAQVENIARGLASWDPQNAERYQRNARTYISRLDSLSQRMHRQLQDLRNREIITCHEAFPYFAREFGLTVAAVVEREPGSEPSARELAETIELVRRKKIKALFAEPQYPSGAAQAIARETGAQVYILDPLATGPQDDLDYYLTAMERNLKVLGEALK